MRHLYLFSLMALLPATAPAADVPRACTGAYEQIRAGQLAEAADSMAQCAQATPTDIRQTIMLFERVQVLDRLGRHDEALAQLIALTGKAHFETGVADEFSGPGVWSRDPDKIRARQATGINRADLLLDIAWRKLRDKDHAAAIDWAGRSARHALTRFKPEAESFPMDADAGCALALRGFARAEAGQDPQAVLADLARGYIRGCGKLPVADKMALLSEDSRRRVDDLKHRFDALQGEVRRVSEAIRARNAAHNSPAGKPGTASAQALGDTAFNTLMLLQKNQSAVEPVLKVRAEFLAAEADLLGPEPLIAAPARP